MPEVFCSLSNFIQIVFLITLTSFSFHGCSKKAGESEEIKIGLIASLTGPAADMGKNWSDGAKLAKDTLEKEGIRIKLFIEDDQTQTVEVAKAFHRMASVEKVQGIIGGTWDYLAEVAYPLARTYKVPFITSTNPPEILSSDAKQSPYVFTNGFSLRAEEAAIRSFLKQENIQTVALVYPALPIGVSHAEIFQRIALEGSIRIALDEEFPIEGDLADTLRSTMVKISAQPIDLVYLVADYQGVDLLTKEMQIHEVPSKLLTTQHLDQAFLFSQDKKRYARSYAIYPNVDDEAFERLFQEKYGERPKVYAAHGYDALMLLGRALHVGMDITDPRTAFQYQGITGLHQIPSKNRALADGEAVVMTTRSGEFAKY